MPKKPRRLGKVLAAAGFAADVDFLTFTFTNSTTADATFLLARMPKCKVRSATYVQTADATAVTSYTATLVNATGPVNVTAALDIKAIAATAGADFVLSTVAGATNFAHGDILRVFFDETGGTVTAPGLVTILVEVQLLN